MRVLRIGLRVSMALSALGFLGFAAGFAALPFDCPDDGCTQPTSAMVALFTVAAAGSIGAAAFTAAIHRRQSANPPRPQPVFTGMNSPADPTVSGGGRSVAQFRPAGLDLREGFIPFASSIPWAQRFTIRPDGLEMRNVFGRAWAPRDRITGLYRMPREIRVIWDDGDCTATVSDWRIKEIAAAMEQAGYRFDAD